MMFQSQNLRLLSIKFLMGDILLAAFNDIFSFVLKYLSPRLNFSQRSFLIIVVGKSELLRDCLQNSSLIKLINFFSWSSLGLKSPPLEM